MLGRSPVHWIVGLVVVIAASNGHAMSQVFESLSPFTNIDCDGEHVRVEYRGVWYGLESVNDVPCQAMLDFCKKAYGDAWEERFATGLVEVLTRMGHRPAETLTIAPGTTVRLRLRNLETGGVERVTAAMTRENQLRIWRAYRQKRHDRLASQRLSHKGNTRGSSDVERG